MCTIFKKCTKLYTFNIHKFSILYIKYIQNFKNCTKFVHSMYTKFSKIVPHYVYLMYPKIQRCTKFCTLIVHIFFQIMYTNLEI